MSCPGNRARISKDQMKRKRCEIKDRKSLDGLLKRCTVGRMATLGADGYPYITPLNYVYYNEIIYFHCARSGEKLDNIKRDPRVCFEIDIPLAYLDLDYYGEVPEPCMVHQFYHSVVIRGKARIVEDSPEKVEALNALVQSHEPEGRPFVPVTMDTEAAKICAVIAIEIERISGKSDLAQKKSDEEKNSLASFLKKRGLPGDAEASSLIAGSIGNQEK